MNTIILAVAAIYLWGAVVSLRDTANHGVVIRRNVTECALRVVEFGLFGLFLLYVGLKWVA